MKSLKNLFNKGIQSLLGVFYKSKSQTPKMHEIYYENVHYEFVKVDEDIDGLRLLLDEYKNVLYHYQKVRVTEEDGKGVMNFGYTIVEPGNWDIDDLNTNEKFHKVMGDILTTLLIKRIEDEQNRNDNTEKFTFE